MLHPEEHRHHCAKEEFIVTSSQGKDLVFMHPAYGPEIYCGIQSKMDEDNLNLKIPTTLDAIALAESAFDLDSKLSDEIRNEVTGIMYGKWILTSTAILYIPNKGAYVHQELSREMFFLDKYQLVNKLGSNVNDAKFVLFGYQIGKMSIEEFKTNPFLIALAGEEGAANAVRLAGRFKHQEPFLGSFNSIDTPTVRFTTLFTSIGNNERLYIDSRYPTNTPYGFTFGIKRQAEGPIVPIT